MITGDNIWHLLDHGNGYVFSMSIAAASDKFKAWVLDEEGYTATEMDGKEVVFKIKSRLEPREIYVTNKHGKKVKKNHP